MRRTNSLSIISCIIYLCIATTVSAQQAILKDTLFFTNKGTKIKVVNTTIRQYYNDSNCVWELKYPQLFGLTNADVERTMNTEFQQNADLGDCNDKGCEENAVYFSQISHYWDMIEIISLGNNLLSYKTMEGTCLNGSKHCIHTTYHYIVDVKTGTVVSNRILFKSDVASQEKLKALVIAQLGFKPKDMNALTSLPQYYLKEGKLHLFYDVYTLTRSDKEYDITLEYDAIENLLADKSLFLNY